MKSKYSTRADLLSGAGASEIGGKWNEVGIPLVYTSTTSSLALLETFVHMTVQQAPPSLVAAEIALPLDARESMSVVNVQALPDDWRDPDCIRCVEIGSAWAREGATFLLNVPSAVNPLERNLLLNPAHPLIAQCEVLQVVPIVYDRRLVELLRVN